MLRAGKGEVMAADRKSNNDGIGASILRMEDRRFLLGRGRFVADIAVAGEAHCVLVRSPHAHARVVAIDTTAAAACTGVIAVLTGSDMAMDGVGPMRPLWAVRSSDGAPMAEPPRWHLARGLVRHVGDPVAAVIAETIEQALDAAEAVMVDYEPLPAVTSSLPAREPGAPQLHAEAPGNIVYRFERGDAAAVDAALATAAHVVRLQLHNNRLVCAALEPRAVLAVPEINGGGSGGDKLTLYCTTQAPHHIRTAVTQELGVPLNAVRLISPDVGGGFGTKGKHYPEETIVPWAAKRLGRPVKWVATRTESFISDTQARDHHTTAELALSADGAFLALRVDTLANIGAYVSTFGASIPSVIYSGLLAGPLRSIVQRFDGSGRTNWRTLTSRRRTVRSLRRYGGRLYEGRPGY